MATETSIPGATLGRRPAPWILRRHPLPLKVWIAAVLLAVIVFIAFTVEILPFQDPYRQNLSATLREPWLLGGETAHPFGTDNLGRDLFARTFAGLQRSLRIAAVAVLAGGLVGVVVGVAAGYVGGLVDGLIQRLIDLQLALPYILLALALITALGASDTNLIIVLAVSTWVPYAKVARAETLPLKTTPFVDLARVAGASQRRIVLTHILPHTLPSALVVATLQVPLVIVVEASLSFLGAGVQVPDPSIGNIVRDGRDFLGAQWWFTLIPAAVLVVLVLAMSQIGDYIRDRLDPNVSV